MDKMERMDTNGGDDVAGISQYKRICSRWLLAVRVQMKMRLPRVCLMARLCKG